MIDKNIMNKYTIYHNQNCSKSRQTLALLQDNKIEPNIILYLDNPPTLSELAIVLKKLKLSAREIIRTSEAAYKENQLSNTTLSDEQLLNAIITTPKLLQRPIVVKGDQAIIGRPPESVLSLIK